jgi:DNA polymerase-3 subunit epsilon
VPIPSTPVLSDYEWVAVDVETATPSRDSLCSLAAVRVTDGEIKETFSELVMPPGNQYAAPNMRVHGLTPTDTARSRGIEYVAQDFWAFVGPRPMVAHNAPFDSSIISQSVERVGLSVPASASWFCTLTLAQSAWPDLPSHRLSDLCEVLGIPLDHHQASSDALACALIGIELLRVTKAQRFDLAQAVVKRGRRSESSGAEGSPWFPEKPRISPDSWSSEELADAQLMVDLWLSGKKLKEIDEAMGQRSGYAVWLFNRLRSNGLPVPKKARGRGEKWQGNVPETLQVRIEHLGRRNALAKDTPDDARIVVFTGVAPASAGGPDRSQLEAMATEAGWLVRGNVTKKTEVLVKCDPTFEGGKTAKAKELGTRCLSPDEFVALLRPQDQ